MFGLYIHIPYCLSKCNYCDFYSMRRQQGVPEAYVEALLAAHRGFAPGRPDTLYFGGGTPSLLTPTQVAALVAAADPLPGAEITLEANPETLTAEKLAGYRAAGVNRLSLGVQTARDDSLRRLGRPHTAAQSRRALQLARQAGFTNISGDIMLALPHYSRAEFDETLALLAGGGVTHISAYMLKIEPGTPFGANPPAGLPGEDAAADFYLYATDQLARLGYRQYEISNFAKPGFESRHNLLYWDCEDYLGLGPAAYSCMDGQRFHYPADTHGFIAGTAQPENDPPADGEDYIMLQLRLNRGLSLPLLASRYNMTLAPWQLGRIAALEKAGFCSFDGQCLCLTPAGMLVQNAFLGQLLYP